MFAHVACASPSGRLTSVSRGVDAGEHEGDDGREDGGHWRTRSPLVLEGALNAISTVVSARLPVCSLVIVSTHTIAPPGNSPWMKEYGELTN